MVIVIGSPEIKATWLFIEVEKLFKANILVSKTDKLAAYIVPPLKVAVLLINWQLIICKPEDWLV